MTMKAFAQGYKAVFTPGATVYHFISASRMTPEYFERRAYYQGVCDSYSRIRREGRVTKVRWHLVMTSQFRRARELAGAALRRARRPHVTESRKIAAATQREINPVSDTQAVAIQQRIQRAYKAGFEFHRDAVNRNPELLAWVLRSDYWDYHLPRFKNQSKEVAFPPCANPSPRSWISPLPGTAC